MGILRDELKNRNYEYNYKFENIVDISKKLMPKSKSIFSSYTNHDLAHLENVEYNADKITEKISKNLSDEEIFCLLSAIWLHDIGMIPFDSDLYEFENSSTEERENLRNNIRERHNIRSNTYIVKNKDELKLSDLEAKAIGNICKGHRNLDLNNLDDISLNSVVHTSSLAAILRLADECDITKNRETVLSDEGINERTKKEHYRIHKLVNNIIFDSTKGVIRPISYIYEDEDKELLINRQRKIQKELDEILPFLKNVGINFTEIVFKYHITSDLLKRKLILCIAEDKDIFSLVDNYISKNDVIDGLEVLIDEKIAWDYKTLTKDFDKFKQIYKIFLNKDLDKFFVTDYVQEMISKNFIYIEDFFNVDWEEDEREYRIKILKNSPTSLYFLMCIDEIIKNPKFRISANQNGSLMFDSILSFGLFNDIYHYSSLINFDDITMALKNFNFFNEEYVLNRIMHCKILGDEINGK